jgi:tetratricopeptide (TPR) repeat protein
VAGVLQSTNRFREAESFWRRALAIDEKIFGFEHPKVAVNLDRLAFLLEEMGRLTEAESLYRRSLEILIKVSIRAKAQHPNLSESIINYGALRMTMGDGEAEANRRIVEIFRVLRREPHGNEASWLECLISTIPRMFRRWFGVGLSEAPEEIPKIFECRKQSDITLR